MNLAVRGLLCWVLFCLSIPTCLYAQVKESNVAGHFYPLESVNLRATVHRLLIEHPIQRDYPDAKIIMAPHAGYIFSAGVVAKSFNAIKNKKISTIILIGPSHFHHFEGVAIWPEGSFKTPLGQIKVDESLAELLMDAEPAIHKNLTVFSPEHSLEVELPFIQTLFPDAKIVPLLYGTTDAKLVVRMAKLFKQHLEHFNDRMLVVSVDLSHYHDYDTANRMDQMALDAIIRLDAELLWSRAVSGEVELDALGAVASAMVYAKGIGIDQGVLLEHINSGDTDTGEKSSVVGYAAVVFSKGDVTKYLLDDVQKKVLLDLAHRTVDQFVRTQTIPDIQIDDIRLSSEEGAFVTLHSKGALRGCLGQFVGSKPLYKTVQDMAVSAASMDHRFKAVGVEELEDLDIEVSVLSRPFVVSDVRQFQLGMHGVILSQGSKRGVFLPQVASETGWTKEEFLTQLCVSKVGLPANCWEDNKTRIELFTADVFSERDYVMYQE